MKVLITGATGYIGGRLTEYLLSRQYDIRAGTRTPSRIELDFPWCKMDFNSERSLQEACGGVDAVVHLAAVNEIVSAQDPEIATTVNILFTQRLLKAAMRMGVSHFIYLSTFHVYGSQLNGTISEDHPTYPAHPYSISHKAAEDYLCFAANQSSIGIEILRLTNSFGYPIAREVDRWSLIVNDACKQLAHSGEVRLRTAGTQKRDFITLTDVCRAIEFLLTASAKPGQKEIVNIGSGHSSTILEMVQKVTTAYERLTGEVARVEVPIEAGTTPVQSFEIDNRKLTSKGFTLLHNDEKEISELLCRCLEWFRRQPGQGSNL